MIRIGRTIATALCCTGLLAGCAQQEEGAKVNDPQTELSTRPTSAQIMTRYDEMQQRIRQRLDAELGPFRWEILLKGSDSTCAPEFSGLDGKEVWMPRWGFKDTISDADWPRAKQIVTEIVAEYGFTTPTLQVDRPGDHETSAADPTLGAQFNLGTNVNTLMRVKTGCHRGA